MVGARLLSRAADGFDGLLPLFKNYKYKTLQPGDSIFPHLDTILTAIYSTITLTLLIASSM